MTEGLSGIRSAIIIVVNELTQILAVVVVVTHCVAIFWPRKPLKVPTDENGLPVLWRNETEEKKDVVCVWWDDADDLVTAGVPQKSEQIPPTSFSNAVKPLQTQSPASRRSVA